MLKQQIQNGESKKFELKEKLPSNEAIAKTVIAFSNVSGGKLVIGVNDDREVVGVDEDKIFEYEEKISSIISDLCYPNILPEIYVQNKVMVFRGLRGVISQTYYCFICTILLICYNVYKILF